MVSKISLSSVLAVIILGKCGFIYIYHDISLKILDMEDKVTKIERATLASSGKVLNEKIRGQYDNT